jgi:DNA-binding FadR family transcriptional regulator
MKMLTLRHMWTMYKRTMLQEGLGITRRNEVQILVQKAFYLGAQTTLQALATLLEDGDVEQVHRVIEHHGRQIKAMQGLRPRARRH